MSEKKTLLLIDGHALAFRQYFALERTNMKTRDGRPTWAVYGFFKAIFDLLKDKYLNFNSICVAFDVSHRTFRTEKYEDYKANRESMPDNLQVQMQMIYDGLQAFNIPIYTKEGFEADDVIGTIAKKACKLGHEIYILTGDQDSFQLIDKDDCIKVIIPSKGELIEYDWDGVYKKLGVYPDQIIDYKSLRGDTSDNIPGVKGIGEKTAVALLAKYGHLDNILNNIDNIEDSRAKRVLTPNVDMAKLSYFLATIICDVDIDFDFEATKIAVPNLQDVTVFLTQLQFYSFLKRLDDLMKLFNKNNETVSQAETATETQTEEISENGQLGLFTQQDVQQNINTKELKTNIHNVKTQDDLKKMIDILNTKTIIACRTNETDGKFSSVNLAYNDNFDYKDKLIATDTDCTTEIYRVNLSEINLTDLKPIFENENIKKIVFDGKNEYKTLKKHSIELKGIIFDPELASYIKNSSAKHTLDIQSIDNIKHYLVINSKEEIPEDTQAEIMSVLFELTKYWLKELDENELKLLYNVEIPTSQVLAEMELTGVSLDVDYLKKISDKMEFALKKLEQKIYNLADEGFNINSPKQVSYILFDKLKLKLKNKKKGKSTSAEVLEELSEKYEIAKLLLKHRKLSKLKSTYTDALPELISPDDNRVHTTYNQTTTATGRLSSSNPNLQNIPSRTAGGSVIRKAFITDDNENKFLMSADYSQVELRILAHTSQDEHLIEAFCSNIDVHALTASKLFGVPVDKVTKEMRYKAKAVNFGIIYGQTSYGLAKSVDMSVSDANMFIKKYFEEFPKITNYMDKTIKEAETKGFTETLFGRKRYFSAELHSTNYAIREFAKRAAINHPMQGTAADLIKMAMIEFDKKLKENNLKSKLIMQVHDELVVETWKNEAEDVKKILKDSMELNQPLLVPLEVDIRKGSTWYLK